MPQRPAKSKQELSLDHLQHPIARCGPIQGEIDISPIRILLRLLRDILLLRIGRAAPALGPSRRLKSSIFTNTDRLTYSRRAYPPSA
jgi:hypothetical protein